ncbi:MAG: S4 domain-containing protein [Chitinophagales bacterium]
MQKKNNRPTQTKSDEKEKSLVRLNKFIANAGICNRREADEYIAQGLVKVNGKVVNTVGIKVAMNDIIELDDHRVYPGVKKFVLLNKPKGFTCSHGDADTKSALDLVKKAFDTPSITLHPMDVADKGLVVVTNDLQLASKVNLQKDKTFSLFKIEINKPMTADHFKALSNGLKWKEFVLKPHKISFVEENRHLLGMELNNNQASHLRSAFQQMGYLIKDLDRVVYSSLTKKNLTRGQWRYLTENEIIRLRKQSKGLSTPS